MKEVRKYDLTHAGLSHQSTSVDGKPSSELFSNSGGFYGKFFFLRGAMTWLVRRKLCLSRNTVSVTLSVTDKVDLAVKRNNCSLDVESAAVLTGYNVTAWSVTHQAGTLHTHNHILH
jgi:hypothetical protein